MIPELGHFALALAVALAFAQAVVPLWGAHRRDLRLMQAAPALALGQFLARRHQLRLPRLEQRGQRLLGAQRRREQPFAGSR